MTKKIPCPVCKKKVNPDCKICEGVGEYEVMIDGGEPTQKVERKPGAGYNGIPDPNDDIYENLTKDPLRPLIDTKKQTNPSESAGMQSEEMIDWSKRIDPNKGKRDC
jgi:hypothetical protein